MHIHIPNTHTNLDLPRHYTQTQTYRDIIDFTLQNKCMYVCMYACMYAYTHTQYTHKFRPTATLLISVFNTFPVIDRISSERTAVCMCVCMYACMAVCMYVCIYVFHFSTHSLSSMEFPVNAMPCVCVYICMHAWLYVCMYVYTYFTFQHIPCH